MILARLALVVAAQFVIAAAFFPAWTLGRWQRIGVLLGLCVPIALGPLLIPAAAPFLRFLASVNAVALMAKLYDVQAGHDRGSRPTLGAFVAFLPNWFSMVLRKRDAKPRPTRRENLLRLLRQLAALVAGTAVFAEAFRIDWNEQPFIVEHAVKVVALFLALIPFVAAVATLARLAGGTARDPIVAPYAARTPADFWRRYNRPVHQFFYEDVFKAAGGLRWPIRATLAVFAVSAVIHEYVFGIAIGRVHGYQTAFFLLQGCAVAATVRTKPRGGAAIPWIAGTLAFNLAASVLFFASLNRVVPFYSQNLPGWLDGW